MTNDPILVEKSGPWHITGDLERLLCGARGKRAKDFHDAVETILKRCGWKVWREFPIQFDWVRQGFIDLMAEKEPFAIALELDNRRPRVKSVSKLDACPAGWLTGVLLRNPK